MADDQIVQSLGNEFAQRAKAKPQSEGGAIIFARAMPKPSRANAEIARRSNRPALLRR